LCKINCFFLIIVRALAETAQAQLRPITQAAHTIMADLGAGYSEVCYQNALFNSLAKTDPSIQKELTIPVLYDGQLIGTCRADIVTSHHVIEIKATRTMPSQVGHQVRKYMVNLHRQDQIARDGVIINFNQDSERVEQIVLSAGDASVSLLLKKRREARPANGGEGPI